MRLLLLSMLGLAPSALAQDDSFDLQTVLVTTFTSPNVDLEADAARLHDLVVDALSQTQLVVPMSEVPAFRAYGADIYLQGCPPGRYVDCAFVVGERAPADWVVGAEIRAEEGQLVATVSFVDVGRASVLLQVDVPFTGEDDPGTADTLTPIVTSLIAGELQTTDVRVVVDDSVAEATVDPAALEAAAEELDSLDDEQGIVDRGNRKRGRASRISVDQARTYLGRDVPPPWEGLGMTLDGWRRWKNSGTSLATWRDKMRGRQASLLVSATAITVQQGPWTQVYEAWYAIDDFNLALSDQYVMQDLSPGLLRSWELQIAGGILPWLEVGVFGGPRLVSYRYRIQRILDGAETQRLVEPEEKAVTTWHLGGRVGFFPMPTFPARPSMQVGVLYWWGAGQAQTLAVPDGIEATNAPGMLLVQASPGVEVDVGKVLRLWARVDVEIPVWRRVGDPILNGGAPLQGRPTPDTTDEAVSVGGSVGATVRIRLTKGRTSGR